MREEDVTDVVSVESCIERMLVRPVCWVTLTQGLRNT